MEDQERAVRNLCHLFCKGSGPCAAADCPRNHTELGGKLAALSFIAEVQNTPVYAKFKVLDSSEMKALLLEALDRLIEKINRTLSK
jgi:hypothetical protein